MILNTPVVGTIIDYTTYTVSRRTLGEQLRQVRPSTWPTTRKITWEFRRLTKTQVDDFKTYVCTNAALTVQIQDEFSNTWEGIIVTREFDIKKTHRNTAPSGCPDNSLYTLSFEFEGVVI